MATWLVASTLTIQKQSNNNKVASLITDIAISSVFWILCILVCRIVLVFHWLLRTCIATPFNMSLFLHGSSK